MSTLSTHILDISTGTPAGRYCLTAETGAWFARAGRESVFTRAQIDFVVGEAAEDHFHLPFLIAPGGWSTYRGS